MLEKPDLEDEKINACIWADFGLSVQHINFLSLGADQNTAVYRAVTSSGETCFVKIRSGVFNRIAVELPVYLHDQGVRHIILPKLSNSGRLWADLGTHKLTLYPFINGSSGYETVLSSQQWREFGAAVRQVHGTQLPSDLAQHIPREDFSQFYPQLARNLLERIRQEEYVDPIRAELVVFLRLHACQVAELIDRADHLRRALQTRPLEYVLCHSDLHPGNLLVSGGVFYIIDWDDLIFAPKECDLMFISGGQGFAGTSAQSEELQFYQGYGRMVVDRAALAYYRCERIVVDFALFCQQILSLDEGLENRLLALHYLKSNFEPGGSLEIALNTELTI